MRPENFPFSGRIQQKLSNVTEEKNNISQRTVYMLNHFHILRVHQRLGTEVAPACVSSRLQVRRNKYTESDGKHCALYWPRGAKRAVVPSPATS